MRRALLPLLMLACACVYSLHPLADPAESLLEPALVGTWAAGDQERVTVVQQPDTSYLVIYTDDQGATGRFLARVTRLAGLRVLDVEPDRAPSGFGEPYDGHLLPLHSFWVIREAGDRLLLASFQPDSLSAWLAADPGAPSFTRVGEGTLVLTADRETLRAALAPLLARPGFLEDGDPLTRLVPVAR